MVDASWQPDPSGAHELRYWNGTDWTEHVSDQGATGQDPLAAPLPPPLPAPVAPPPPPVVPGPAAAAPAPAPGAKLGWKDRLKQAADQGKAMAEQGKAKLAEQSAKRTEQWATDPSTLWFGESKNPTGVAKARYRITKDRVWIESGVLGTRTESVPLWSVRDMDVRQAVWQRGKDIGDVVLNLEDPAYGANQDMFNLTGAPESGTTSGQVVLDNVEGPYAVHDLLAPLVSEARTLARFIAPVQEKLWSLARNLWWSWDQDTVSLFRSLDPPRWRELNQNPVALLSEIPLAQIEKRAAELMLQAFPSCVAPAETKEQKSAQQRILDALNRQK